MHAKAARPGQVDGLLREGARRARRLGRPILVSWTRRAAPRDPLDAFAAGGPDRALWLRPESGESLVGTGATHALLPSGATRFSEAASAWQALLEDALVDDPDGLPWTGPLLLGGFAFDPRFGDGRLVLPAATLSQREGQAWLTTNVVVRPDGPTSGEAFSQSGPVCSAQPPPPEHWQALVASVVAGIRSGELGVEKVVLARACHYVAEAAFDAIPALRRLVRDYPTCTVFALGHADATFLGATPERLAHVHRGAVSTMALAGPIARGATPAEDRALGEALLSSRKDLAEHAIVVRAVREALAGVCSRVVTDTQPRLHRLPNVQHLLTPIRAQLAPGRGLLDLAARLHPSPAVGGFPCERALEVVRDYEGLDRGWYGGPLGWVNAAAEGEFVVGIRSALLRGREAWLYAGCGIVADSDAAAELAESEWKLQPMLAALNGADA